ncbi:ATP-binding cassette domain-containing protein [Streptomyces erythrogriseus]
MRAEPVLDSLDLCVAPGEHLAVVGPSGIGKSTLTRLVAGTLVPSGGEVRVDGREVTGRPPAELSALRVLVPQEAYVFSGTLSDNLTYLRPGASRADLDAAVDALGLWPLVERLGGLDAPVRPAELSHGERQLVALTRAWVSPAPCCCSTRPPAISTPPPRRARKRPSHDARERSWWWRTACRPPYAPTGCWSWTERTPCAARTTRCWTARRSTGT